MASLTTDDIQGATIPTLDDDPFSSENLENPLPFQERLREAGPVVYLSQYGVYAIGRFDDVYAAVANWQQFTSGSGVGLNEPWRARGLLQMDPPEHDAPREVLEAILSSRVLRAMSDMCRARAESLFDDLLAGASSGDEVLIDGHRDIGGVFPVAFFPDASGINEEGRENLVSYADHNFNALGPTNELTKRGLDKVDERTEWATASCQREALRPTGFGADIWAAADRGDIMHELAPLLTRSLLSAGVDTTVYGISGMLYALATHPEQWAALRANPKLGRIAFDETLRWESTVQQLFRKTSSDVTLHGSLIPAGSRVMLCYGAANRDARRWENPDAFDLTRDPSGHLSFGMGMHQCVGQHAARLQADALLQTLLAKVAAIQLAGPIERHHNNTLRGWASVPLRLTLV